MSCMRYKHVFFQHYQQGRMEVEACNQHEINVLQLSVVNEKLSTSLSREDALRFQLEAANLKHELKLLCRPLAPSQNPMAPPSPPTPFFHACSSTSQHWRPSWWQGLGPWWLRNDSLQLYGLAYSFLFMSLVCIFTFQFSHVSLVCT